MRYATFAKPVADLVIELGGGNPLAYAHTLANPGRVARRFACARTRSQRRDVADTCAAYCGNEIYHCRSGADAPAGLAVYAVIASSDGYQYLPAAVTAATPQNPATVRHEAVLKTAKSATDVTRVWPQLQKPLLPESVPLQAGALLQLNDLSAAPVALSVVTLPAATGVTLPKLLALNYPIDARQNEQQGRVMLNFSVATDGSVQNIEVAIAQGADSFIPAAMEELHQWRFDPANATSDKQRYTQNFDFTLSKISKASVATESSCERSTGSHICRKESH